MIYTEEQKRILTAKARVAAFDQIRALQDVVWVASRPYYSKERRFRAEEAILKYVQATATLTALSGGFVPEEIEI